MNEIIPTQASEMMNEAETRQFFGGNSSFSKATLYRLVRRGLIPAPAKVGMLSRWSRSECQAALDRMLTARGTVATQDAA